MSAAPDPETRAAAEILRHARHAVVFTGAGISTPSGIPDFRSQGSGLWQRFDPLQVASLRVFQEDPATFYDWLRPLLHSIWEAQPNPAHQALTQMESAGVLQAVITQNIDDLHRRAGSRAVYEVHGSLRTLTCPACQTVYAAEQFRAALHGQAQEGAPGPMPLCEACQRVLKPDITLFGEMLPPEVWAAAEAHCQQADVMLVVGSSLEVWPAASLPQMAVEGGARLIILNRTETFLDGQAEVCLRADVAESLPAIADLLV